MGVGEARIQDSGYGFAQNWAGPGLEFDWKRGFDLPGEVSVGNIVADRVVDGMTVTVGSQVFGFVSSGLSCAEMMTDIVNSLPEGQRVGILSRAFYGAEEDNRVSLAYRLRLAGVSEENLQELEIAKDPDFNKGLREFALAERESPYGVIAARETLQKMEDDWNAGIQSALEGWQRSGASVVSQVGHDLMERALAAQDPQALDLQRVAIQEKRQGYEAAKDGRVDPEFRKQSFHYQSGVSAWERERLEERRQQLQHMPSAPYYFGT